MHCEYEALLKNINPEVSKHTGRANLDIQRWMKESFKLAKKAFEEGEVPVGCVFVEGGAVLGQGKNATNATKNATRHAEMQVIDEVMDDCKKKGKDYKMVFNRGVFYVTVEPCIMCASALKIVNASMVVYGCKNERFGGCGSIYNIVRDSNGKTISVCENQEKHVELSNGPFCAKTTLTSTMCNTTTPTSTTTTCSIPHLGASLTTIAGVMAEEAISLLKKFYLGVNPNTSNHQQTFTSHIQHLTP